MSNNKHKKLELSLEKGDLLPVLLILPTLLIVLVVMIMPLCYGVFISLFDYDIGNTIAGSDFIGAGNYIKMIRDPTFWKSLYNTVLFALGATAGDIIIGTVISVLLLQLRPRASRIMRAFFTMPLLVSPIIVGLIWRYMYDPAFGFLYWILSLFGIGIEQFPGITSTSTALLSVIIAHWWQVTPFVIIVVSAGLVSIPRELYEAAHIDGAGSIHSFFNISLPLLTGIYMVILVISGVDTIKVFDIIYALTQGGPVNSTLSISIYAYKNAFQMYQMGYAMALSLAAMVVSFLLFGIPFIRFNRYDKERKGA
jgi:multiple sugar transport system permease protein